MELEAILSKSGEIEGENFGAIPEQSYVFNLRIQSSMGTIPQKYEELLQK